MRLLSMSVLSFALLTALVASDVDGAQQKKKKKSSSIKGTITAIEPGKDNGPTTLTVSVKGKKGEAAKTVKLSLDKDTKFMKAGNKKQNTPATTSSLSDVQQGQQITALLRSGSDSIADTLTIANKKKKKAT
jgi:hypothetical protein